jgi:ABC-type oligopeptide transport system substrate-binding subunit
VDNAPLDLLLDLTADQAMRLEVARNRLGVRVATPQAVKRPNLRVYFLAVNQRTPALANPQLRQALAHAIDRESLLNAHFREHPPQGTAPALGPLHAALNGPYPAGSWACDPDAGAPRGKVKESLDLFDPDRAKSLFPKPGQEGHTNGPLRLLYPEGDPAVDAAMTHLAKQVRETLGVQLNPEPLPPGALRKRVEEEHTYDLAYYSYDFPDETYWLWPLLAEKGKQGRENYLAQGSVLKEPLPELFTDAGDRRDFAEVRKLTHAIHRLLYEQMPVIPLWQLDPLYAAPPVEVLEAPGIDGRLTFTTVERWRLKPRPGR